MERIFKTNNFDLLRLFAATEVLLLHSYLHLGIPYPTFFKVMLCMPGVPMFFSMSGYLISASLERNKDLRVYFKNRVLRILPALWVCVILSVLAISIVTHISFFNKQALVWFFSQLIGVIYTPGFLSGFGFGSYNGSLWTIPLEIQFYICLPILYFITNKLAKKERSKTFFIIAAFLVSFAITFYLKAMYNEGGIAEGAEPLALKVLRYTFVPNIYLFLLGVVLQRLKVYKSDLIYGKGLFWLGAYLVMCYLIPESNIINMFRYLVLCVTTISLAYTAPLTANKILKGNDISYGVYIYHGLVLGVIVQLKLLGNPNYVLLIMLSAVVLATLSWKFIEKPFMRKKKQSIHKVDDANVTEPQVSFSNRPVNIKA